MSSGRAVEKPRPITGLAAPVAGSSGITSSSHRSGPVVRCASALLQTPSWFVSSRRPVKPSVALHFPSEFVSSGKFPVTGSAARLTSAHVQSPSPVASVSQTAAIANARTMKMSLSSSPSSRSSAWFE